MLYFSLLLAAIVNGVIPKLIILGVIQRPQPEPRSIVFATVSQSIPGQDGAIVCGGGRRIFRSYYRIVALRTKIIAALSPLTLCAKYNYEVVTAQLMIMIVT